MNRRIWLRGLAVVGVALTVATGASGVALAANIVSALRSRPGVPRHRGARQITGSNQRDQIVALGGNDVSRPATVSTSSKAGPATTTCDGGAGRDELYGGEGNDLLGRRRLGLHAGRRQTSSATT